MKAKSSEQQTTNRGINDMDYLYIRAWHSTSGSFQYYIDNLVMEARKDNAPQNAIYKSHDGKWQTIEDCKNERTASRVEAEVRRMQRANHKAE
jgi:hypothetical protein